MGSPKAEADANGSSAFVSTSLGGLSCTSSCWGSSLSKPKPEANPADFFCLVPDERRGADFAAGSDLAGREPRRASCFASEDSSIPSSDAKSDQPPEASLLAAASDCPSAGSLVVPVEPAMVRDSAGVLDVSVDSVWVSATDSPGDMSSSATRLAVAFGLPKPGRICGGIFAFNASKMLPALLGAGVVAAASLAGASAADDSPTDESAASGGGDCSAGVEVAGFGCCFSSAGGSAAPGVSSSFARIFQLSFIFIKGYFCS